MNTVIGRFTMSYLRLSYAPAETSLFSPSALSFLVHRRKCCRRRLFSTFQCSASAKPKKEKVIVISGPTGAGKSRLALELAKKLNGEIISADSVQVCTELALSNSDIRSLLLYQSFSIVNPFCSLDLLKENEYLMRKW